MLVTQACAAPRHSLVALSCLSLAFLLLSLLLSLLSPCSRRLLFLHTCTCVVLVFVPHASSKVIVSLDTQFNAADLCASRYLHTKATAVQLLLYCCCTIQTAPPYIPSHITRSWSSRKTAFPSIGGFPFCSQLGTL